jgi:hypothetical protein
MATASNVIDVDKGFDPEGPETLDQYRERVLRDLPQPGFGSNPPAPRPISEVTDAVST